MNRKTALLFGSLLLVSTGAVVAEVDADAAQALMKKSDFSALISKCAFQNPAADGGRASDLRRTRERCLCRGGNRKMVQAPRSTAHATSVICAILAGSLS